MEDEKKTFEELVPEMLESVAGGMTDNFEQYLRSFMTSRKLHGWNKEQFIDYFGGLFTKNEMKAFDTNMGEITSYIDDNWDSI